LAKKGGPQTKVFLIKEKWRKMWKTFTQVIRALIGKPVYSFIIPYEACKMVGTRSPILPRDLNKLRSKDPLKFGNGSTKIDLI